jgi:glycosyltransferase involved in cell wall biosynthesis
VKILHVAPVLPGHLGGVSQAVPRLADAQSRYTGDSIALLSSWSPLAIKMERAEAFGLTKGIWIKSRLQRSLPEEWHTPDVVHFHSTYVPVHARIATYFRIKQIPYVMTPHGGLMQFALQHKYWKKQIGNWVFFAKLVHNASIFHCLTERESAQASAWHPNRVVVPNLVEIPLSPPDIPSPSNRTLQFTYIGRLDVQIKGIDRLLAGFRVALRKNPEASIHLNLVGPNVNGQQKVLEAGVRQQSLAQYVTFHGPSAPYGLPRHFQSADVICLCSRSEGQPNIILEAFSYARPCLVTPETNMAECIQTTESGWVCDGKPESIAELILNIVSEPSSIQNRSINARTTAQRQFAAPVVCSQMQKLYQQVAR